MTELRKRDDLTPEAQEAVRKASRDLQTEYLHAVSPGAAQSVEEYRAAEARRYAAQTGGVGPAVVGDDAAIRKAAERLQKADSGLSEYEALELAYKAGSCCLKCRSVALPGVPDRCSARTRGVSPRAFRGPVAGSTQRRDAGNLQHVRSSGSCHRSDL